MAAKFAGASLVDSVFDGTHGTQVTASFFQCFFVFFVFCSVPFVPCIPLTPYFLRVYLFFFVFFFFFTSAAIVNLMERNGTTEHTQISFLKCFFSPLYLANQLSKQSRLKKTFQERGFGLRGAHLGHDVILQRKKRKDTREGIRAHFGGTECVRGGWGELGRGGVGRVVFRGKMQNSDKRGKRVRPNGKKEKQENVIIGVMGETVETQQLAPQLWSTYIR